MSGIYIALLLSCLLAAESFSQKDSPLGIVGGDAVNITEVPFMARYCKPDEFYCCGAAIVHERFLVTSAQCYYNFQHGSYVIIGTDKMYTDGEAYDVEDGFPHPHFAPRFTHDYDVAVLKLVKPLKLNERVKPISLAEKGLDVPEGAALDTMGFGSRSENVFDIKIPDQLQKVSVPIVTPEKCKRLYSRLTERMICTDADMKGSCYYDEGGPLVYKGKLLGVLSDSGCGRTNTPSIYTYIPALRDFIDRVIQNYA